MNPTVRIEDIPMGGVFILASGQLNGTSKEASHSPLIRIWSNVKGEIRAASLLTGDTWTMDPKLWARSSSDDERTFRLVLMSAAPAIMSAIAAVDGPDGWL